VVLVLGIPALAEALLAFIKADRIKKEIGIEDRLQ
jgi:hypothetical protein